MLNKESLKIEYIKGKYTLKKSHRYEKNYKRYLSKMNSLKIKSEKIQLKQAIRFTPSRAMKNYVKGIPFKRLDELGLTNVGGLLDVSNRLSKFRGIGPKSESRIDHALKRVVSDTEKNFRLKFNLDSLSSTEIKYLEKIAFLHHIRKHFKLINQFKKEYYVSYKKSVKFLNRYLNPLKKVFILGDRESKMNNAYEKLHEIHLLSDFQSFNDGMDVFLQEQYQKIGPEETIETFKVNAAQFYSIIESDNKVQYKYIDAMPDNLLEKIKATEVDNQFFMADLRAYQKFAVQFAITQKRIMIGDEMGLGKTIEALAFLAHLKAKGANHFLVVSPASVMVNWSYETQKHSNLKSYIIHGSNISGFRSWKSTGGVGITTYGSLSSLINLIDFDIEALIIDEAHYIKNHKAMRTQLALQIMQQSKHLVLMTGTPLENRLDEFLTLLGYLDQNMEALKGKQNLLDNPDRFKYEISPRYLRRNRADVLAELPPINQVDQWVEFTPHQEEIYVDSLGSSNFMLLRRIAWLSGNPSTTPKMERLKDLQREALNEGRKLIVFSYFKDVIEVIYNEFKGEALTPLTGSMSSQKRLDLISQFDRAKSGSMLISQIEAGGIGLNIQSASMVVICEPQLKPSTEQQAISRVYRMGQTKDVIVYRILTRRSVDESLMQLLETKQFIFDNYAKDSHLDVISSTSLSTASIKEQIINLERQRYQVTSP